MKNVKDTMRLQYGKELKGNTLYYYNKAEDPAVTFMAKHMGQNINFNDYKKYMYKEMRVGFIESILFSALINQIITYMLQKLMELLNDSDAE